MKFKNFEEFASYDWPANRPEDCVNLFGETDDGTTVGWADCFDLRNEGDYCSSCMEYLRRIEAWDFAKNKPRRGWWRLISTQHAHDTQGHQLEQVNAYALGTIAT